MLVGKGEAVIVDTVVADRERRLPRQHLPALQPMKPGSCGPGVLGIYPVIYDEDGAEVPAGSGKAGNICIRNPWPGIFQTIWGQPDRFVQIYYQKYCATRRAPTGTTGRTSPATARCRPPTATSASWAASTT
jgi:acetyl-CoA synthetase